MFRLSLFFSDNIHEWLHVGGTSSCDPGVSGQVPFLAFAGPHNSPDPADDWKTAHSESEKEGVAVATILIEASTEVECKWSKEDGAADHAGSVTIGDAWHGFGTGTNVFLVDWDSNFFSRHFLKIKISNNYNF